MVGRVTKYVEDRGFGFIKPVAGGYTTFFFHITKVEGGVISIDDLVTFDVVDGPKGKSAINVKIDAEAYNAEKARLDAEKEEKMRLEELETEREIAALRVELDALFTVIKKLHNDGSEDVKAITDALREFNEVMGWYGFYEFPEFEAVYTALDERRKDLLAQAKEREEEQARQDAVKAFDDLMAKYKPSAMTKTMFKDLVRLIIKAENRNWSDSMDETRATIISIIINKGYHMAEGGQAGKYHGANTRVSASFKISGGKVFSIARWTSRKGNYTSDLVPYRILGNVDDAHAAIKEALVAAGL